MATCRSARASISTTSAYGFGGGAHGPLWPASAHSAGASEKKMWRLPSIVFVKRIWILSRSGTLPRVVRRTKAARFNFARARHAEPEILLLDEPTNGMDMNSERAIMELLKELQQEKQATIVFVTHLLSTIERYAHRAALITSAGANFSIGEKSEIDEASPSVMAKAFYDVR